MERQHLELGLWPDMRRRWRWTIAVIDALFERGGRKTISANGGFNGIPPGQKMTLRSRSPA
jgi:hypothetical protein